MSKKITLREATLLIMKNLGVRDSVNSFSQFYRPLLEEVNKGNIPREKRGRGNLVDESEIMKYIDQLKEKKKLQDEFESDFLNGKILEGKKEDVFKDSVKLLVMLYKNGTYSSGKTIEEIAKLVEGA